MSVAAGLAVMQAMFDAKINAVALATELGQRDPDTLSEDEVETIVDRYQLSPDIAPHFEQWLGGLKNALKKAASKGLSLAKNAASVVAKLGLGPILNKLLRAWNLRVHPTPGVTLPPTGHPDHRSDTPGLAIPQAPLPVLAPPDLEGVSPGPAARFTTVLDSTRFVRGRPTPGVRWDHLIYAYMIANTRVVPIFRRVVHEFLHGEKFGAPREDTQLWLRNTEELFFRDPPPFPITTITSHVRQDVDTTERQAYSRMFRLDLNHGDDDNSPYLYVKVPAASKDFVPTFEGLLRETWIGFINRSTTSGANPTDDARIEDLARRLNAQLLDRRQFDTFSREAFYPVAEMSWFHLTLENKDFPIIRDLRAEGSTAEQVRDCPDGRASRQRTGRPLLPGC